MKNLTVQLKIIIRPEKTNLSTGQDILLVILKRKYIIYLLQ